MSQMDDLKIFRQTVEKQLNLQRTLAELMLREHKERADAIAAAQRQRGRERQARDHARSIELQQRFDDVLRESWGVTAPAARADETFHDYNRRLCKTAKKLLPSHHDLRSVQYVALPDDALETLTPQLLDAVRDAALDASTVAPGTLRAITKTDQAGVKSTEFVGESFVRQMGTPARRVLRILGPREIRELQRPL